MVEPAKPSLNELAMVAVRQLIAGSTQLRVRVHRSKGNANIIDCGIEVPGSLEAGRLVAEACMGGLGGVTLTTMAIGEYCLPVAHVATDAPALACIGAQAAGWNVKVADYFALGSGPARASARVEAKLFETLNHVETCSEAVLLLETRTLPNAEVCKYIAKACKVKAEDLYLLVAPTASIVGSVQFAARIVETGIHKLKILGFDLLAVLSGTGLCPVAPVARKDAHAMGLTNDAILMMGQTFFYINSLNGVDVAPLIRQVPSSTSSAYGKPFRQIFKDASGDFYKIDKMLFAPAQIAVSDLRTGQFHAAGKLDPNLFLQSLRTSLS
jgi:methenyltetrahydromethanopterin cyclohydrolase